VLEERGMDDDDFDTPPLQALIDAFSGKEPLL
jgi:hypothetical protein